ncbi:TPA: NADP-dependent oxidoreductase [Candidatus Poribacteria bacterium]|jgi:NADPH-dependent curcumin reductase CurA|nr:NADP-dependent oxidoreductase [Candidatus Poribacteria bacterium]HIB86706.1 NADP-dependent oxidoreductase [Candidatus Poribacteria bacterium]HIB98150.1 NADP-dependent oxidoreductase [Candidatus Poribacteria bacterium]HIN32177.1 NADP-dependent oxidoreductase [Candidatus Poribacteria bacterium]HIO49535.1 NADP-dependent oxidoreductase [Candidatus Poribacteria bacterium]
MPALNRQIVLASRPDGYPIESNFELVENPIPDPAEGEILVRTIYLSVDPYMRGRMNASQKSYAPPVGNREVITGGVVGEIVKSKHDQFQVGDIAQCQLGWQAYGTVAGETARKIDLDQAPISTSLGILGMPGLTAYFGLLDVCEPQAGETVFISGAAGAVGSLVGQIAKIKGCRAVGSAGTDQKVEHVVSDLGFDAAYNYKATSDYVAKIAELCSEGVDVYFDNVGGKQTDSVFPNFNIGARISICGQISQYNRKQPELGPRLFFNFITKRLRMRGFLVFDFVDRHPQALAEMTKWLNTGKLQYRETITNGLENAPTAFISMLKGGNLGKQLVKVSDEI